MYVPELMGSVSCVGLEYPVKRLQAGEPALFSHKIQRKLTALQHSLGIFNALIINKSVIIDFGYIVNGC